MKQNIPRKDYKLTDETVTSSWSPSRFPPFFSSSILVCSLSISCCRKQAYNDKRPKTCSISWQTIAGDSQHHNLLKWLKRSMLCPPCSSREIRILAFWGFHSEQPETGESAELYNSNWTISKSAKLYHKTWTSTRQTCNFFNTNKKLKKQTTSQTGVNDDDNNTLIPITMTVTITKWWQ